MTTRTVTVQQETEEEVVICDHCGLSEDAGEIKEYVPRDAEGMQYGSLDLHRDCLDEFGVDVPEKPTFAETFTEYDELNEPPALALTKGDIELGGLIALIFGGGGLAVVMSGEPLGFLPVAFAVIPIIGMVVSGREKTKETIDDMRK